MQNFANPSYSETHTNLELKQALPNRIRVGHCAVVNHGDASDPPAQEAASHITAKSARAQEEALGAGDGLEVKGRKKSPSH